MFQRYPSRIDRLGMRSWALVRDCASRCYAGAYFAVGFPVANVVTHITFLRLAPCDRDAAQVPLVGVERQL